MFHPIVLLFLIVWFGGSLFGVGLAIYHITDPLLKDEPFSLSSFIPLAFTVGIVTIGYILVSVGLRMGQDQREAIAGYLCTTLDAEEVSSDMNAC